MSLIADALDAAQRERAKRTGIRQVAMPESPSSFRSVAKRGRPAIPRELGIALAGFAAVIVVVSVVTIMTASSRNQVRPISAGSVAPPIPLPIQTPTTDSIGLAVQPSVTNPDTMMSSGFDAYDRAIQEYEQVTPPRSTFGRADDLSATAQDELTPPAPKPVPKGTFKITMQASTPAIVTDRLFQQALAAQQRGDFVAARNFYTQSLAEKPSNAEALNNLGAVHRSLGDNKKAEESYRRALDIDPRFAPAWSNLAVILDSQGKRQEATAALQEALQLDPRNVSTKVNLAIQFSALGVYPEARRLLEEAIKDNATLAEAHYTLGQVLEKQGDKQQAIIAFRTFLATSKGRFPRQEIQVRQHLRDIGG